jgi:hypothetical protein
MKDKNILIRVSKEELEKINDAYKQFLIENDLISRSEFIRRMVLVGAEGWKNGK